MGNDATLTLDVQNGRLLDDVDRELESVVEAWWQQTGRELVVDAEKTREDVSRSLLDYVEERIGEVDVVRLRRALQGVFDGTRSDLD
jgi:hypothetical protein